MLDQDIIVGLDVALDEATLLGVEIDKDRRVAAATFDVLTLPDKGSPPDDRRVLLLLHPVGRVAASLRLGLWNDDNAEVVKLELDQLMETVESFQLPIYGADFFDRDEDFKKWNNRLSVDCTLSDADGLSHSITLFQEGTDRHLDIRIWFDSIGLQGPTGQPLEIAEFIAGGKRWWDGLYYGDPRTKGKGIYPLK